MDVNVEEWNSKVLATVSCYMAKKGINEIDYQDLLMIIEALEQELGQAKDRDDNFKLNEYLDSLDRADEEDKE